MDVKDLVKRSEDLYGKRGSLMSLWQEIADAFYCERADFTVKRHLGQDFAAHLTTSYPLLVRRDLGDQISSILRQDEWFEISVDHEDHVGNPAREWLQDKTKVQRRAMYDIKSNFVRATKEGDHDWVAFGQCAISIDINWETTSLLYRCWHLRDVAWLEDENMQLCEVHRKWMPRPHELLRKFKGKCHANIEKRAKDDPFTPVNCLHVVMETAYWTDKRPRGKYTSLYIDIDNQVIMEEVQRNSLGYVIPRWKTVSGSQYAFSPATVIALPDARLIQAMALSLLEAGEMAVRPPLMAVPDAIREDVQYFAGGITKVALEGDQQLKNVMAPVMEGRAGPGFGMDLMVDTRSQISSAFYINKLTLPPVDRAMTAYETSQRVQEYVRQALPLFEPLNVDYNGEICEQTFNMLMAVGAFGPMEEVPEDLRGEDVKFKFRNPLQEASDRKKGSLLQMAQGLTVETLQLDSNATMMMDAPTALRDALNGIGVPAKWLRDEDEYEAMVQQKAASQQAQQQAADVQAQAEAAEQVGKAQQELSAA